MKKITIFISTMCLTMLLLFAIQTHIKANDFRELGKVKWSRDFDKSLQKSKKTGKPIFILFNEVPGCSTCVNFGQQPLQHPIIISAIENEFEAVAIYNNHGGKDAKILKKFNEPSWNNPVIRFVNSSQNDIIPRQQGYSTLFVFKRIIKALKQHQSSLPKYLELVAEEYLAYNLQTATFAMSCYWLGEKKLGALPGIIKTQVGFIGKNRVVELKFNPQKISYTTLLHKAREFKCATSAYARTLQQLQIAKKLLKNQAIYTTKAITLASKKNQKFYLQLNRAYYYLPLTERQATLINSNAKLAQTFLAPKQLQMLLKIQKLLKKNPQYFKNLTPQRSLDELPLYYQKLDNYLSQ